MATVVFDADAFLARFPQLDGKMLPTQLGACFEEACLLCRNDDGARVPFDPENGVFARRILLYLLTCHIATLALRPPEQPGTMTNASEGSVSVGFNVPTIPGADWYLQTPCGGRYWALLRQYALGGMYVKQGFYHPWG